MKKKIGIALIAGFVMLTNIAYAKYVYYFEETIVEFTRDTTLPSCQIAYSTKEETNQNVIVTITANKEIQPVSGFELAENKKTLTKKVTENEKQKVSIRDFSGNSTVIEYEVNNIDKEPPQILGCENNGTYKSPLSLEYYDNHQIQEVKIDKYSESLLVKAYKNSKEESKIMICIEGQPLNTRKYRYYINDALYSTVTEQTYIFTALNPEDEIKVEALDEFGNVLDMVVVEEILEQEEEKKVILEKSEKELIEPGNYQIKVTDFAGNETVYQIKVE